MTMRHLPLAAALLAAFCAASSIARSACPAAGASAAPALTYPVARKLDQTDDYFGVKIADPDGGMMAQHWEPFADALANAPDPDALLQVMDQAVRPRLFLSFVPLVSIRIQRQLHRLIHTN